MRKTSKISLSLLLKQNKLKSSNEVVKYTSDVTSRRINAIIINTVLMLYGRILQVENFTLTLGDTSAIPSSTRVSLFGEGKTWTVFINKTCSDTFYHWTSDMELTNCVTYVIGLLFIYLTGGLECGLPNSRALSHARFNKSVKCVGTENDSSILPGLFPNTLWISKKNLAKIVSH